MRWKLWPDFLQLEARAAFLTHLKEMHQAQKILHYQEQMPSMQDDIATGGKFACLTGIF